MSYSNKIKDYYLKRISRNLFLQNVYQPVVIVVGILIENKEVREIMTKKPELTVLNAVVYDYPILIFICILYALLIPFRLMKIKVQNRLIKSIESLPGNEIEIVLYNNEQIIFDAKTKFIKKGHDWYLGYFVSGKNGIFNNLAAEESKGFALSVGTRKLYFIPGIFETNVSPF